MRSLVKTTTTVLLLALTVLFVVLLVSKDRVNVCILLCIALDIPFLLTDRFFKKLSTC